jgi:hypothetical protein
MRECAFFFTGGSLWICLRRRGILRCTQGNYVALAGKSAFKLLAHFLGGRRILGASDHADEEGEEGEGFHLEM